MHYGTTVLPNPLLQIYDPSIGFAQGHADLLRKLFGEESLQELVNNVAAGNPER